MENIGTNSEDDEGQDMGDALTDLAEPQEGAWPGDLESCGSPQSQRHRETTIVENEGPFCPRVGSYTFSMPAPGYPVPGAKDLGGSFALTTLAVLAADVNLIYRAQPWPFSHTFKQMVKISSRGQSECPPLNISHLLPTSYHGPLQSPVTTISEYSFTEANFLQG